METPNSGQRRNPTQNSHVSHPQDAQHPRGARVQNERSGVTCNKCGATCALRTANTANNRGRKFYTCQTTECNFFVWEDETGNDEARGQTGSRGNSSRSRSSSSGRRGGRSQGQRRGNTADATFVTATGDPVSGRCYVCGDPSHFANVCPNRGN